jgi:ATP-binding cassette subfamily C protein CydD
MKLNRRLLHQEKAARVDLILAIGLGLLAGIMLVGQARCLSRVVGQVFLKDGTLRDVQWLLLLFLSLALVRAGASWGSEVVANRMACRIKVGLRQRLATHLLALGPAYARGERSGELTNTVVEGVEALDAYLSQYLPQLALAALIPLTILVVVFPMDWVSGLVLLLTAPLIPAFMVLIGSLANAVTRRQWTSLSRMSAHFLDVLQGLATLKLLERSRDQIQTIAQVSDRYRDTTLGVLRVAFLSALVMELVATLSTAVVAVEIGLRVLYARLAFEQAFFILLLAPEFYLPLRLLGARFHAGITGVTASQRIFEVLDMVPTCVKTETAAKRTIDLDQNLNLEFADVHYAYENGQRPALKGFSCRVGHGQRVALVGPSGAGKTTVAHLLLRFIEPDQGAITVNGVPLWDILAPDWREKVAWVPQDPYLFHTTVADNIRLARPGTDLDEVIRAARQAHTHEFIQALPQGYDTLVGERGARLSGGQAQRVALARAFLRDAPLLILDEATSNLDPVQEALLQEAIERLMQGRTVLVIAHRLNTVYRADQILVMAGGQVVEAGTHATLMSEGGLYRKLVTAYGSASETGVATGWTSGLAYGAVT